MQQIASQNYSKCRFTSLVNWGRFFWATRYIFRYNIFLQITTKIKSEIGRMFKNI